MQGAAEELVGGHAASWAVLSRAGGRLAGLFFWLVGGWPSLCVTGCLAPEATTPRLLAHLCWHLRCRSGLGAAPAHQPLLIADPTGCLCRCLPPNLQARERQERLKVLQEQWRNQALTAKASVGRRAGAVHAGGRRDGSGEEGW